MKKAQISIFIDESGDFGKFEKHCPYYIVTMVIHEQSKSITKELDIFENRIANIGFPKHSIHTMPLIRKDQEEYALISQNERVKLFTSLFTLAYKLPINYHSFIVEKEINEDDVSLSFKLTKQISVFLKNQFNYFNDFDEIIIYYDNGQIQLTKIIISVFTTIFSNIKYKKVLPVDYRLFQIADLFCTLELLNEKSIHSGFTKSELSFFGSVREFKRNYYKQLIKRKI